MNNNVKEFIETHIDKIESGNLEELGVKLIPINDRIFRAQNYMIESS